MNKVKENNNKNYYWTHYLTNTSISLILIKCSIKQRKQIDRKKGQEEVVEVLIELSKPKIGIKHKKGENDETQSMIKCIM